MIRVYGPNFLGKKSLVPSNFPHSRETETKIDEQILMIKLIKNHYSYQITISKWLFCITVNFTIEVLQNCSDFFFSVFLARGKFERTREFFFQKIRTFALTSTNLVQQSSPANQTSGNLFTVGDWAKKWFHNKVDSFSKH